jgi:hypothetical protein
MSAFALPMPPGRLTALPSSAYGTLRYHPEDREQRTENGSSDSPRNQALQHARDRLIFVSPLSPGRFVEIAKIERIARPYPHLVRRSDRHRQKAFELRLRTILSAVTFSDIRTDRFARPPDLIAQRVLFDPRQLQAYAMNLERQTIGSLEDLKIFKRFHFRLSPSHRRRIQSVVRPLISVLRIQSFGSRLEPRYIFGAETLKLDQ